MRRSICCTSIAVCLLLDLSLSLTPIGMGKTNSRLQHSELSALPNLSGPWGTRGVPSKTARESAYNVEWEPMTELERRIEDGVNYEHFPSHFHQKHQTSRDRQLEPEEDIPTAQGVFAGYRYTEEEYKRLKSADPRQ